MITQGIKRWLKSLFAWWPWGRTSTPNYSQSTGPTMQSTTQEALLFTATEGPHSQPAQPGVSSVAIEAPKDETISEEPPLSPKTPRIKPVIGENNSTPIIPIVEENVQTPQEMGTPTTEQRLEFLRYLVKRGIVNEGDANKP